MATSKAKTAKRSGRAKKIKPTSVKSVPNKNNQNAKKTSKPVKKELFAKTAKTTETVAEVKTAVVSKPSKVNPVKIFFARKGNNKESILTIFKDTRIIAALLAEIIGTGLITAIVLSLGLLNPLYVIFAYIGITMAVFRFSGAHLNPAITAGMMASRRTSAIRGVLYIVAQMFGAYLAFVIIGGFRAIGTASGNINAAAAVPALANISDLKAVTENFSFFWPVAFIELIGTLIISFCFARALCYKRGAFTFAALVGSGVFVALLLAVVINGNVLGLNGSTFAMNPAVSMVYGVFPKNAESFDALMGALMPMFSAYIIFPVLGGILGFYLSDFIAMLAHESLDD